jgi:hypothetical protein
MHPDWFLQTLEGTPEAVYGTLARINLDPRHQNLRIFEAASTASRLFEAWAMHVGSAEEVSPLALWQCSHAFRHARYPHPEPLLAALKESTKAAPEILYCWDAPRRWDRLHAIDWHSRAARGLLEQLTAISRHDAEHDAPIRLSSAMGVSHDYRHSLRDGLRALYPDQASVPPPMLEQIARMAGGNEGQEEVAPSSGVEGCFDLAIVTSVTTSIPEATQGPH